MNQHPLLNASFLLFQLATASLFLRPAELFEPLAEFPIYEGLMASCLLLTANEAAAHFTRRMMTWQPITLCVVGVLVGIIMSQATHFYLGGIYDSTQNFLKTVVYYALLIANVNSPSRLKAFCATLAAVGSLNIAMCVLDFYEIQNYEFIQPLIDLDDYDDEGNPIWIIRMRGTGIFQDPNDLAMMIVALMVLCLYFLMDKQWSFLAFGWIVPLVVLAIAMYSTKSRGGLLAACAAIATLAMFRMGPKMAMVFFAGVLCLLPIVAGRQGQISLDSTSTGGERVLLWREGYEALKSPDLLFGIGQGFYADMAGLVAHNSFIHAYVELGVFGGTWFFGTWFFAVMELFRSFWRDPAKMHPELLRFRPYLCALLAGWVTSMLSLSRCYVAPTYMVLGLCATYCNLVAIYSEPAEPLVVMDRWQLIRLIAASAACFIGFFIMTITFA